ncbi:Zinc-binding dehydrogenase [Rhizoctonia solani]|uniref:Zinc-binding dehydrogenase n=1 Tax=Rhizoctonia solani TaxID=456999 RepID=A0A8H8P6Y7_9AGAM|nr:Zinc-binding dehydrogenase [Rhizoctonia solani]QRW25447.1 Zinc-binding dehydrogenase [Rhizoctonia solani]
MAQQHKASLLLQKHGKLEVGTRPTPVPHGTQALVKVTATARLDGAGIIHAVGPDVTDFKVGDRVTFQGPFNPADQASFQEFTIVETDIITKTPENINDDQASTIPTGAFTAYSGLFQRSGVAPPLNGPTAIGKSVLILGGSSSVGQYAIQFARIAGFSHIVTTASSQHASLLKSLGATHVCDRSADAQTIQSAFPATSPVSLVFDTISIESTQTLAFDVLGTPSPVPNARVSILHFPAESLKEKIAEGKIVVDQIYGSTQMFRDMSAPFWKKIGQWIEGGEFVPNHVQLVNGGLGGIPEALDLSRKGVSGVKLVVRPQE